LREKIRYRLFRNVTDRKGKPRLPGDDLSKISGSIGFMILSKTILPLKHNGTKTKKTERWVHFV